MKAMKAIRNRFLLWFGAAAMLISAVGCGKAMKDNNSAEPVEAVTIIGTSWSEQSIPAEQTEPPITIPAHYTDTIVDGNLTIQIDAAVMIPEQTTFPVYLLAPSVFNQERVNQILSVLEDSDLYDERNIETKAYYQTLIDAYTFERDNAMPEEQRAIYQAQIDKYRKRKASAPEASTLIKASRTLDAEENQTTREAFGEKIINEDGSTSYAWSDAAARAAKAAGYSSVSGLCWQKSGRKMYLEIKNTPDSSTLWFGEPEWEGALTDYVIGAVPTLDAAVRQASDVLLQMGVEAELLQSQKIIGLDTRECLAYQLTFCTKVPDTISYRYNEPWDYFRTVDRSAKWLFQETITVVIDGSGVKSLHWSQPITVSGVEQENSKLLDWETVTEVMTAILQAHNGWTSPDELHDPALIARRLQIDTIRLSYMQVQKGASAESRYYIPVWDFSGKLYYQYDPASYAGGLPLDENGEVEASLDMDAYTGFPITFLTINAMDGTVINRSLGY